MFRCSYLRLTSMKMRRDLPTPLSLYLRAPLVMMLQGTFLVSSRSVGDFCSPQRGKPRRSIQLETDAKIPKSSSKYRQSKHAEWTHNSSTASHESETSPNFQRQKT
jgi:hypothetical protein